MAPPKRKRKFTFYLLTGGGALLVIFLLFAIFRDGSRLPGVTVEQVQLRTIVSSVIESGTVEPVVEVKIAPDVSGEVVELNYNEGDPVKKGDELVTIRPDNYRSAVEQATASLNQAIANQMNSKASLAQARANFLQDSTNYVRDKKLFEGGVISKLEFENVQLKFAVSQSQYESARQSVNASFYQVENSRASLRQAQQNLQRTTLTATMDGTITRISRRVGERAVGTGTMEGTEILRIADLSRMRVSVEINENDIVHIKIGDTARVKIDAYAGKIFKGRVSEIAYSATEGLTTSADQVTNFVVKVEIEPSSYLKDPEIMRGLQPHQSPFRPGMSAQVEIFTERVEGQPAVPIQSVTVSRPEKKEGNDKGQQKQTNEEPKEIVYVLKGSHVEAREVKTGISDDKYILITAGLKAGETVVTGPYLVLTEKLKGGAAVRVIKEGKENEGSNGK